MIARVVRTVVVAGSLAAPPVAYAQPHEPFHDLPGDPQEPPCDALFRSLPPVDVLRDALARDYQTQQREHDEAVIRARRAARAPEYVRVQAGGRYDRDSETRARLVQDFNGLGEPTKSGMEDRNTHQDDLYIDLRIAAEWRVSRTRWSDADVALRREAAQQADAHRETLSQLYTLWISLGRTLRGICEPSHNEPTRTTNRRAARDMAPTDGPDAWLEVDVLIHQLNDLSDGALEAQGINADALRHAYEHRPVNTTSDVPAPMPD